MTAIWIASCCEPQEFLRRARIHRLGGEEAVRISNPVDRSVYLKHFKQEIQKFKEAFAGDSNFESPTSAYVAHGRLQDIDHHMDDILTKIGDRIHAKTLKELLRAEDMAAFFAAAEEKPD